MASPVNTYKCVYHFEQGGKKASMEQYQYIQAANSSYATLKAVLSSNSLLQPGTLVFDSVEEVGHGDNCIA